MAGNTVPIVARSHTAPAVVGARGAARPGDPGIGGGPPVKRAAPPRPTSRLVRAAMLDRRGLP
jgi:hypothetical protein